MRRLVMLMAATALFPGMAMAQDLTFRPSPMPPLAPTGLRLDTTFQPRRPSIAAPPSPSDRDAVPAPPVVSAPPKRARPSARSATARSKTTRDTIASRTKASAPVGVQLALSPRSARVAPPAAPPRAQDEVSPDQPSWSRLAPTESMWFYQQYKRDYLDTEMAIRRRAENKAAQRRHRLAHGQWYGYSNSRPTWHPTPWAAAAASPRWSGNDRLDSFQWWAAPRTIRRPYVHDLHHHAR